METNPEGPDVITGSDVELPDEPEPEAAPDVVTGADVEAPDEPEPAPEPEPVPEPEPEGGEA